MAAEIVTSIMQVTFQLIQTLNDEYLDLRIFNDVHHVTVIKILGLIFIF